MSPVSTPTNAFACLIRFYKGSWQGKELPLNDSDQIVEDFSRIWKLNDFDKIAKASLENIDYWDEDLTKVKNLQKAISIALEEIEADGIEKGFVNYRNRIS